MKWASFVGSLVPAGGYVRRSTSGALLLCLVVCTDPPKPQQPDVPPCDPAAEPVCGCEPPTVEIGDGLVPFNLYEPGQNATIWHGPQGGWHILASVRVANTSPFVNIGYTVHTVPDMVMVSNNLYSVQLPWSPCLGELDDIFGYLEVSALVEGELNTPPELLLGKTLRLTMTVTDIYDRVATSTVDVVGELDPMDLPDTGATDSGATDSGATDSGATDSGAPADSGATDSGAPADSDAPG